MNLPSLPASYLNPWHLFPANPYALPPPPPVAHKVWILDCKSCGTFLTNRGMKVTRSLCSILFFRLYSSLQAVLLLRPNVALYSSDALPVNCSAYSSNPNVLRPAAACPSSSAHPLRTCECLTQTLCCHSCGSNIGYMIVIPVGHLSCHSCLGLTSAAVRSVYVLYQHH